MAEQGAFLAAEEERILVTTSLPALIDREIGVITYILSLSILTEIILLAPIVELFFTLILIFCVWLAVIGTIGKWVFWTGLYHPLWARVWVDKIDFTSTTQMFLIGQVFSSLLTGTWRNSEFDLFETVVFVYVVISAIFTFKHIYDSRAYISEKERQP